jgi:hypothetical protein
MRQSPVVVPLVPILFLIASVPALAASQPGDYLFSASVGIADTQNSGYGSDDALTFSLEYQKTGYAAYRATAGFFTIDGGRPSGPASVTPDVDGFYVAGNFVLTPRFAVLHPFFTAGVGFYNLRLTDGLRNEQDLEMGLNWGLGLGMQVARHFMLEGNVSFHYLSGDVASPIQILSFGGRFVF